VSTTWEAFFVDEARLRTVYGSHDEPLIQRVEATRHWQFLVDLSADELARNLEYAKKVAPRPYEPLQRVDLDPGAALRDVVLGRELRSMGVEFYDTVLWCICEVIGTSVEVEHPGTIWELERVCREIGERSVGPEEHAVHPYLPVPVVRRATTTDFAVFSPKACMKLLGVLERRREELEEQVDGLDEWLDALGQRDASAHMLVFGA